MTARARTRAELAEALRRRGIPTEVADAVLARFTEVGLVDDVSFAEAFALSQHRTRGLAGPALASKLRRRGLDDGAVRAALGAIDADSEEATARALVQRKAHSLRHLEPAVRERRLYGLLARRGYSAELAGRLIREASADGRAGEGWPGE